MIGLTFFNTCHSKSITYFLILQSGETGFLPDLVREFTTHTQPMAGLDRFLALPPSWPRSWGFELPHPAQSFLGLSQMGGREAPLLTAVRHCLPLSFLRDSPAGIHLGLSHKANPLELVEAERGLSQAAKQPASRWGQHRPRGAALKGIQQQQVTSRTREGPAEAPESSHLQPQSHSPLLPHRRSRRLCLAGHSTGSK